MALRRPQQDAFRCIAFRLGNQSFAVDTAVVVSAHEAGYVGPVTAASPPGATGTLVYGQEQLPVFNVAEWLGIPNVDATEREHSVIVRSSRGRLVLQVRDVSRVLTLAPDQRIPLPPPLDQLVSDRYSAILKWTGETRELSADDITLEVKTDQQQTDLFLQLNPDIFLAGVDAVGRQEQASPQSDKLPASAAHDGRTRHRLLMFAPTLGTLEDRSCLFGISAAQVLEVCRPLPLSSVPGAEDHVQGVVLWRDSIVPVLRMAEMIGLESLPDDQARRLLIARSPDGGRLVGVHVTSSIRTQPLPIPHSSRSVSLPIGAVYAYGAFELEQSMLVMPNLSRMLHPA